MSVGAEVEPRAATTHEYAQPAQRLPAPASVEPGNNDPRTLLTTGVTHNTQEHPRNHLHIRRWLTRRAKAAVTLAGLLVAGVTLWPSYVAMRDGHQMLLLAQWTALKDYIEYCNSQAQQQNPAGDCKKFANSSVLNKPPLNGKAKPIKFLLWSAPCSAATDKNCAPMTNYYALTSNVSYSLPPVPTPSQLALDAASADPVDKIVWPANLTNPHPTDDAHFDSIRDISSDVIGYVYEQVYSPFRSWGLAPYEPIDNKFDSFDQCRAGALVLGTIFITLLTMPTVLAWVRKAVRGSGCDKQKKKS